MATYPSRNRVTVADAAKVAPKWLALSSLLPGGQRVEPLQRKPVAEK
jgi:hypothetical protein